MPDYLAFGFYSTPFITNEQANKLRGLYGLINICKVPLKGIKTWHYVSKRLQPALWLLFSDFLPYFTSMRCVEVFKRPHDVVFNLELLWKSVHVHSQPFNELFLIRSQLLPCLEIQQDIRTRWPRFHHGLIIDFTSTSLTQQFEFLTHFSSECCIVNYCC